MANPLKGEMQCEVGNVVYTLFYDWDALCSIEKELGTPIGKLGINSTDIAQWSASSARIVFWYGLRKHHKNLTLQQAGDMIAEIGGLTKMIPILNLALGLAFPEIRKAQEENENPTMPGRAIG